MDSPLPGRPERIGRYRILRELARGGMGVVFEAEQDAPRRVVALKVVSAAMADDQTIRRFELEARVLGHLQHPCIAQVYEAGLHVGPGGSQPFFAMELVRGVPLDRYAREHRLDTCARLELLARICDGVQHAHQRGVIHRDLKPANILVDEEGQPKILDFGLARATDADLRTATLQTDIGQIMGTIPYMSPEQAAGDPAALDTRTDVYSLGVVGYQLLSGAMPYAADDPRVLEALRVVREEEARPLSSINRALRGDVETIVGKALAKEPDRRYASAADLASDIRRHLRDEPIQARPPSAGYQLRKFARRNKAVVGGAAAVFLALLIGLIGTARGYFRARAEAERAQRTAAFFQEILAGVDPAVAQGSDTTLLKAILDDTAEQIETEFAGRPDIEASIRGVMARAYFALSEYEAALTQAQAALDLTVREEGGRSSAALAAERLVAVTLGKLQRPEAEARLADCLRRTEAALGADSPETIDTACELGILLLYSGRADESAALLERALDWRRRNLAPDSEPLLVAMNSLGLARIEQRRLEEAEELLVATLARRREACGESHPETIKAIHNLGGLYSVQQRFAEAEALYREALERDLRILGERHETTLAARMNLANLVRIAGRTEEAIELHQALWRDRCAWQGPEHVDTLEAELDLMLALRQARRAPEVAEHARHSHAALLARFGPDHPSTLRAVAGLAWSLGAEGDMEGALALQRQLLETRTRLQGAEDEGTLVAANDLGVLLINAGRLEEALPLTEQVLAAKRRVRGDENIETLRSVWSLAVIHHRLERRAEAVPLQAEFLTAWAGLFGDADPYAQRAAGELAENLARLASLAPHVEAVRALLAFHERTLAADTAPLAADLVLLGEALLESGTPAEALEPLERALGLSAAPAPRALAAYGTALTALGRLEEAAETLELAWNELLADERVLLAQRLAALHASAGRPDQATEWRRRGDDPPGE